MCNCCVCAAKRTPRELEPDVLTIRQAIQDIKVAILKKKLQTK